MNPELPNAKVKSGFWGHECTGCGLLFDDIDEAVEHCESGECEGGVMRREAKRGPQGKQCRDCHYGVAHQFTDKLFYCMKTRDRKGNPGKTQRTWTCEQFTERKPA